MTSAQSAPQCVPVPLRLVSQCAARKGTLLVYGWAVFACQDPETTETAGDIARMCRMKRDDVFKSLAWLTENGWLRLVRQPGKPSVYLASWPTAEQAAREGCA